MNTDTRNSLLDYLTIVGFAIGVANYQENVGQSEMQDAITSAVSSIDTHLKEQDDKINKILERLGIEK